MKTEHTPEPWRVDDAANLTARNVLPPDSRMHVIHGSGLAAIAFTQITGRYDVPFNEEYANARRIVACVNFLEKIPTETLEFYNKHGDRLYDILRRFVQDATDKIDYTPTIREIFDCKLMDTIVVFDDEDSPVAEWEAIALDAVNVDVSLFDELFRAAAESEGDLKWFWNYVRNALYKNRERYPDFWEGMPPIMPKEAVDVVVGRVVDSIEHVNPQHPIVVARQTANSPI
jgi:hypothetical protein